MEQEEVENTELYTVLNVAQDASDAEIRSSYRRLAQVFHPDKAPENSDVDSDSNANFMRIQEAYEVLSNPEKRQIYDVYGEQGLSSGLEVGEYLRKPEEVQREYERWKAQEKSRRKEASVAHRGHYLFKIDACDCIPPFEDGIDAMPELSSMASRNSVQLPLSDNTAATIGCQVAVRKRSGGGSFVCGIRRNVSRDDTVECQVSIGLKQFAHLEVRRQLGNNTSASVATSYQPQAGLGLSLSTSRQLSDKYEADLMYQVGPESVMSFGLTRRGLNTFLSGRLELGTSTGVMVKAVWQATASVSLRMSAKFGTMGIELELAGTQKLTEFSSAGCAVVAGLQGVVVRPKFSRGGHVFEVPIMVSPTLQDYKILAAAYILPPTISLVIRFCIVKPLRRHARRQKILSERAEKVNDIEAAVRTAKRASKSLQAIANRKMKEEAEKGGLVILNAKFGTPEAIKKAQAREVEDQSSETIPNGHHAESSQPNSGLPSPRNIDDSGSEADQEIREALDASCPLPEQWLDVTNAVRYLVNSGKLVLHKGYSKASLMGFADVAIDEEKVLTIIFMFERAPYHVTVSNQAALRIPGGPEQKIGNDAKWLPLAKKYIKDENLAESLFAGRPSSSLDS